MKNQLKLELYKVLHSRYFLITLCALVLIVWIDAAIAIGNYQSSLLAMEMSGRDSAGHLFVSPALGSATAYNRWIGGQIDGYIPNLFYFLLPVFAVIPYAWSFLEEAKSGYTHNIITRTGKRVYFLCKYIATFVSGVLVILIPLVVSFVTVLCFIPAYMPDMQYDLYYLVEIKTPGSTIFFSTPVLYVLLYILLASLFAGIWATLPMAVSFFTQNRFVVLFAPFIVLLFLLHVGFLALYYRASVGISPLEYLRGANPGSATTVGIIVAEFLSLFVSSFAISMGLGVKKDVF